MTLPFFRRQDLTALAAWGILGVMTAQYGGAMLWVVIAPVYAIVLCTKLVLRLIPSKREQASLRLMWLGPAVFLATLPLHVYRFNTARDAGNQLVTAIEQYRVLHGVFPPDEEALVLDPHTKKTYLIYYDGKDGKPLLFYASPLAAFDTYRFDFERKAWTYEID